MRANRATTQQRWLACVGACLCAVTLAFACLPLAPAYAEDDDNVVDEQQLPDSSFVYDTSIMALAGANSSFDNQTVQVVGEVIGDSIREGLDNRHKWITLAANEKDSTSTVSVSMTAEQAAKIDTYGKYGTTGTKLQVRGTFHLVCPEHEGLSDLHASHVSIVRKGTVKPDELDPKAFVPGAVCLAVGLLVMFAYYRLRERQR